MIPPIPERAGSQGPLKTALKILGNPRLRKNALRCIYSIMDNFFFLQYKAALLPGRIPVTPVDHPLDQKIPFSPQWAAVYLDFISFWIRILGFLLSRYGRRAFGPVGEFISAVERLYRHAAAVYQKNLSTTKRPRYYRRPRFLLIHAADPHLLCVPSLHVMLMINAYTRFAAILRGLGEAEQWGAQIEEVRQGALAITEAVLYVKQHSINCIAAAMYAMTCFDGALFPETEARQFAAALFTRPGSPAEGPRIREYIAAAYQDFLAKGRFAGDWKQPLLDFLRGLAGRRE
ncbi:MAG: hypothetical protein LBD37_09790 [Treponema sp.]|nr:hypothetical protein [Treponema sp.]